MHLDLFQHETRRREFEDDHRPNGEHPEASEVDEQPRLVAPAGAAATALREPDSEWPWWLSSPATDGDPSSRVSADSDRPSRVKRDESDEPTSPTAA
jgi:hypothetical protein